MLEAPTHDTLREAGSALGAIVPFVAFGFARQRADGRVAVFHRYHGGLGEFAVDDMVVLDVVRPVGSDWREAKTPDASTQPIRAFDQFLRDVAASHVVSAPLMTARGPARMWVGLPDGTDLSPQQRGQIADIAAHCGSRLSAPVSSERMAARYRRLELAAGVLPALLNVLDLRTVFDRLSDAAREALPHDLLLVTLFSEDLTTFSVFARSGHGLDPPISLANSYPPDTLRSWRYSLYDDQPNHVIENRSLSTKMGGRSSVRVPIRFEDNVIGGVSFVSFKNAAFSTDDVPIARRIADHVAVGLSHYQLAEKGRDAAILRERAANLDLLDALLDASPQEGDVGEIFERISTVAGKVLPHDAAALMVRLPDGTHGRVYASRGFPPTHPEIVEIPEDLQRNRKWDFDLFHDLTDHNDSRYVALVQSGFRSMLRVPIRREGQVGASLLFVAAQPASFTAADAPVARRIADRLALTLAHDRELAASRRADEAVTRAAQLEARVRALTDELNARTGFRRVVGESPQWRQALTQAAQVAATTTTVLLLGESGTGKEVVARFLHRGSARSGGPFVALNCAALPEQLLEAELFGYERGAFTGATQSKPGQLEQASGGTLFLDEVAEMSPSAQAKFLRVLQEREFQRLGGTRPLRTDARIIAATNRDLPRDIANGKFREDLYYRLNVFTIQLPPLRERRDDILILSAEFLAEIGRGLGRPPGGISRDARQRLVDYHWPGNVRELRNILERAAILCDGGLITTDHLAFAPARPVLSSTATMAPAPPATATGPPVPTASGDLSAMERTMIEQALQAARFNKSKAAKALGLTRHQLYIRLRRHGFET